MHKQKMLLSFYWRVKMPKILYGLHKHPTQAHSISGSEENLIYIDDAANGLSCHCFCINCGGKLVAKQGEIREHHFAHSDSIECTGGYEVSIITKVELILKNAKTITLPELDDLVKPGYKFSYSIVNTEGNIMDKEKHIWSKTLSLTKDNSTLFVEILFSGDHTKYVEKYKEQKQSAISINLKELHDFTPNALREAVLNSSYHKSWIYNQKAVILETQKDSHFKQLNE